MRSITLIGMPGVGKSTFGEKLAKQLGFRFLDLDEYIKERTGTHHAVILEEEGAARLCALEDEYARAIDLAQLVFSPGGSIIYSPQAMERLRAETVVVNLELPLGIIEKRLANAREARGVVGLAEKGLAGIYAERIPLYQRFAHHTINAQHKSEKQIIEALAALLR